MSVWGEVCRHGRSWQEKAPLSRRCPSHKEAVGGEFAVGCSPFWPRVTASVPPGHASCLQVLDRELLRSLGAPTFKEEQRDGPGKREQSRRAKYGKGLKSKIQDPSKSPWILALIYRRARLRRACLALLARDLHRHFLRQLRRWQRHRDL